MSDRTCSGRLLTTGILQRLERPILKALMEARQSCKTGHEPTSDICRITYALSRLYSTPDVTDAYNWVLGEPALSEAEVEQFRMEGERRFGTTTAVKEEQRPAHRHFAHDFGRKPGISAPMLYR